jgi:hypothetical protein
MRVQDREIDEVGSYLGPPMAVQRERELATEVENRRTRLPFVRQNVASSRPPFFERADDPRGTLGQRRFDLANRHPARRAHAQSVEADLHADRASPCPHEGVLDPLVCQRDTAQPAVATRLGCARSRSE